jgi:hypothetical protein
MTRMASVLVAAALLAAPAVLTAQSLGEVAAKEKERRDKSTKPAKSYTENDLRSGGTLSGSSGDATPAAEPSPSASPTAEGGAAAATSEPSEAQREADQKAWHANRARAQSEIARISAAIVSFQARLNDNTGPMYGPGRQSVAENLERAKADLVKAQATLDTLDAQGRTNGYR